MKPASLNSVGTFRLQHNQDFIQKVLLLQLYILKHSFRTHPICDRPWHKPHKISGGNPTRFQWAL